MYLCMYVSICTYVCRYAKVIITDIRTYVRIYNVQTYGTAQNNTVIACIFCRL